MNEEIKNPFAVIFRPGTTWPGPIPGRNLTEKELVSLNVSVDQLVNLGCFEVPVSSDQVAPLPIEDTAAKSPKK